MFPLRQRWESMVSYDAGVEVNGLLESPQPWIGPPTTLVDCSPRGLSALTHSPLASRFFCWQGLSGKGYIFSVYAASDCPAFCDAILLGGGARQTRRPAHSDGDGH